jgi:hypothetical protein
MLFVQADPALGCVADDEIAAAKGANPALEHVTLTGSHHWLEGPDQVVDAIGPFLDRRR